MRNFSTIASTTVRSFVESEILDMVRIRRKALTDANWRLCLASHLHFDLRIVETQIGNHTNNRYYLMLLVIPRFPYFAIGYKMHQYRPFVIIFFRRILGYLMPFGAYQD